MGEISAQSLWEITKRDIQYRIMGYITNLKNSLKKAFVRQFVE